MAAVAAKKGPKALPMALSTPLTELFKIKHPVMLAGMAGAAGPELAAAVSNAGGLGNIGGASTVHRLLEV